jgi:hypothetical protein
MPSSLQRRRIIAAILAKMPEADKPGRLEALPLL